MTQIRRSPDCDPSCDGAATEGIALALLGVGTLDRARVADAATWDRPSGGTITGGDRICATAAAQTADLVRIEQVITQGRAGSVTGRVTRGGTTRLFCHMIRFTGTSDPVIAQLVSFEHPAGG